MKQTCDDRDIPHEFEAVGYRYLDATPPEPGMAAVMVCLKCLNEHLVPIHQAITKVVAS